MDQTCETVAFGRFTLDPARRLLLADGAPVSLSSRGFDILQLLVEHRERIVTKDEILRRVWRGMIVEENNLAVQISALRRALAEAAEGATLIATVPGQGYRFVGSVAARALPAAPAPLPDAHAAPPRRPGSAWRLPALGLAFAVLFGAGAALLLHRRAPPTAAAAPRLSIAVLPFRNLGADRDDDYLADAVSDDLTTDLSHIPGSLVIARESADSFRGRAVPTPEIGRALNVRYLLEGSLRGADGEYSINAQLIEAATGAHLWAQRFEVPRVRISETQETIVGQIASALNVQLVEAATSAPLGTGEAFDDLYRARSMLDRSDSLASMSAAQNLLEKARAARPQDVGIQVELAKTLIRKIDGFQDPQRALDRAEARQAIEAAAAIAPADPDVMSVRAFLLADDGNCDDALKIFQDVLTTYNDSLLARSGLAHCLTKLGRNAEAAEAWRKLLQIDPFGPSSRARDYQLGRALLFLGRPEEALVWLDRSAANDAVPSAGRRDSGRREWGELYRIAALVLSGQQDRAERAWRSFDAVWPHRTTWRLQSETQSAQVRKSAGFQTFLIALRRAGMPEFAREDVDDGVAETAAPETNADPFAPTPLTVHGQRFVTTAEVDRLRGDANLLVLDTGSCGASVPGAVGWNAIAHDANDPALHSALADPHRLLVVMGDGPYGWDSHNLAQDLLRQGTKQILWYRGGEEAWAHARLPQQSCRSRIAD